MTLRQITMSLDQSDAARVIACAEDAEALSISVHADAHSADRVTVSMISASDRRQDLLDALQRVLSGRDNWRINILHIEASIPFLDVEQEGAEAEGEEETPETRIGGRTREEIFNESWANGRIDRDYIVFVLLSGVTAAFGMIADNVAVVIGAMVIAPLLGPVLAFSVGVALGEERLMLRAALAATVGVGVALLIGLAIGVIWPVDTGASELQSRTDVGFDGIAIALASGAAAALSIVTGVSSALVGVMVAVALLPPATASGVFLGSGEPLSALNALLLLALNIVCVNLAAQTVMFSRGITPRTWFEKRKARRHSLINVAVWLAILSALAVLLVLRTPTID